MNVLLFPGSFSPVHVGHLALANYILETEPLYDELWFLLTPSNPLKDPRKLLPPELRKELLAYHVGQHPRLKLALDEWELPTPSYTWATLEYLSEKYPDIQFTLLLGLDSLTTLPQWKNGDQLMREYPILVYPRSGDSPLPYERLGGNIRFLQEAPIFDLSSSFIRSLLSKGGRVPYLLSLPMSHPLYRSVEAFCLQTYTETI